jgi:alkylation response protein AidB-like acyl-CoA dehydrogenase
MTLAAEAFRKFKKEMIEFIWQELDQYEEEIESSDRVPLEKVLPKLRRMRCFGMLVPEAYGGVGLGRGARGRASRLPFAPVRRARAPVSRMAR